MSLSTNAQESSQNLDFRIHWEGRFNTQEKEKVTLWLSEVSQAVSNTLGPYSFPVNYYIYEKRSSREPVPWANTLRSADQGVNFHIDPSFSLSDFQTDWTAPHEIAHLSLPFVGRSNMWFSEGYASYMQWRILEHQGVLTKTEMDKKYNEKLVLVKQAYNSSDSFMGLSEKAKGSHNYPALYWGGACYFFMVDALLKEKHGTSLEEVIQKYQTEGRLEDETLEEVITSLDLVSKSTLFSDCLKDFREKSGKEIVSSLEQLNP